MQLKRASRPRLRRLGPLPIGPFKSHPGRPQRSHHVALSGGPLAGKWIATFTPLILPFRVPGGCYDERGNFTGAAA